MPSRYGFETLPERLLREQQAADKADTQQRQDAALAQATAKQHSKVITEILRDFAEHAPWPGTSPGVDVQTRDPNTWVIQRRRSHAEQAAGRPLGPEARVTVVIVGGTAQLQVMPLRGAVPDSQWEALRQALAKHSGLQVTLA